LLSYELKYSWNISELGFKSSPVNYLRWENHILYVGGVGVFSMIHTRDFIRLPTRYHPNSQAAITEILHQNDRLIFGTDHGLSVLDLEDNQWDHYDVYDGLKSNQILKIMPYLDRIIIITTFGVQVMSDEKNQFVSISDTVLIHDAVIWGEKLLYSTVEGIFEVDLSQELSKKFWKNRDDRFPSQMIISNLKLYAYLETYGFIELMTPVKSVVPKLEIDGNQLRFLNVSERFKNCDIIIGGSGHESKVVHKNMNLDKGLIDLSAVPNGRIQIEFQCTHNRKKFSFFDYLYHYPENIHITVNPHPNITKNTNLQIRGKIKSRSLLYFYHGDYPIHYSPETGDFEITVELNEGENVITLSAIDNLGKFFQFSAYVERDTEVELIQWVNKDDTVYNSKQILQAKIKEKHVGQAWLHPENLDMFGGVIQY
jgi:hypothetical protein